MSTEQTSFTALLETAVSTPGTISSAYRSFHNYSLGNQLLAMMQCHERELPLGPIATFPGWKDKGRFVKRGEKAISLCMPITIKAKGQTDDDDPAVFTRFVYKRRWFVLAQTDGAAYQPDPIPDWDATTALAALDVSETSFEGSNGNVMGYAREREIAISPLNPNPHKTRFHELAHILLGHTAEGQQDELAITPRNQRELEAECVALLCCEALGLPGADESRGYIQTWWGQGNPVPEKSAQKILKTADQILKVGTADPGARS